MKLSKQERIGALIILAVVILALGAFVLIKPKFESIGSTTNTLAAKQSELDEKKKEQSRKVPLRAEIEAAYQEGEHLADMFFPELTAYEADNAFRAFVRQCKVPVVVEEITVSEPATSTLAVTFFTPTEVSYALKSYVSQGVDVVDEDEVNTRRISALSTALASSQTIGSSSVEFTVSALTQDDIVKFVDEVNNYFVKDENLADEEGIRKAIKVNALTVPYDELNSIYEAYIEGSNTAMLAAAEAARAEIAAKKANPELPETIPEGTPSTPPTLEPYEETLPYTYSDTMTFFSIERMQNPKAILDEQDGIFEETPAA